jgi:hypothetical protein
MCHERVVITLENITTLDHSADLVYRLLPSQPVVFRFFTLNEYVRMVCL